MSEMCSQRTSFFSKMIMNDGEHGNTLICRVALKPKTVKEKIILGQKENQTCLNGMF